MPHMHDSAYWSGRRVLVTGHTGFKGSWLSTRLRDLGAKVHGVSLPGSHGEPSLWDQLAFDDLTETRADIATSDWISDARDFSPHVVLHLAAQSLVSEGYRDPALTFRTNVMGTVQVLDLLRGLPELQAGVIVTTDKVYDVRQRDAVRRGPLPGRQGPLLREQGVRRAGDPVLARRSTVPVATARAGNVIGGGDWSVNRIVPDIVRAWSAGARRSRCAARPRSGRGST